jgi:hypothetical protein
MVEHARQQRLVVKCRNRNNGMDPLIGTIVVASAPEVDDGMSTYIQQYVYLTVNDSILDCHRISSAPQQVHLTFYSWQYNLGPDRRELIGIISHVLLCHCIHLSHYIIIAWL